MKSDLSVPHNCSDCMITMRVIKLSLLLVPVLLVTTGKSEADKVAILNDHARENLLHSQFSIADKFAGIHEHYAIAEEMVAAHRSGLHFQNLQFEHKGQSNQKKNGIDIAERHVSPHDERSNIHMGNLHSSTSDPIISHEFLLAVAVGSIFVGVLLGLLLTQGMKKRIRERENQLEIR